MMNIHLKENALRLLEDFIHCACLHPERLADAMGHDLDGFVRRLRCLEEAFSCASPDGAATVGLPRKKARGNRRVQPSLPGDFDCRFPEPIGAKVREWLAYKAERGEFYTPTGLRNLLTIIDKRIINHHADLVIGLISECMANNWAGIIWDRIGRQDRLPYGWSRARDIGRYSSPSEVDENPWEGFASSDCRNDGA